MSEYFPEILSTPRCVLRIPGRKNAGDLFSIYGDGDTMAYMQRPPAVSGNQCEELIEEWKTQFSEETSFRWGIFPIDKPSFMIGTAALHYWSQKNRRIELGVDLNRNYHSRGIATEITQLLIQLAFESLKVNRIEIRCHPENRGSTVIAEKLGFRFEGILREYVFVPGKGLVDEAVYSLLSADQ